jgi:predicted ATPase/DNA-binding CsgD family transcriptional regulator
MTSTGALTSLVGRQREISELTRLLSPARLVTLTGAGGVGKTRLALAVAQELGETFADGVAFVDLAPLIDANGVLPAIARTIGIRDDGELPLADRLASALRDRELLLVLDNFEHVLGAGPQVVKLLQAGPRVTALVTSRAALRVRGEREFSVEPLGCPETTENVSVEALQQYPALELFVERAQDIRPAFRLGTTNAAAIVEICRRVDGLPLALELAAARIRVLPPEAMRDRLSNGLSLLTRGARDLPARQQTMRATIAWSYDLLNPAEQELFRRLSVFAGDFSLAAAFAVAAHSSAESTLDLVTSLMEKNLLRPAEGAGHESRFRMLQTVCEFGREQLESHGELDITNHAQAAFYVALVEEAALHLRGADREPWMQRIDVEMDNLRSVVAWSSPTTDECDALVRIVRSLGFVYWRIRGHLNEGLRWCELALEAPAVENSPALRANLLWTAGGLAGYMGRLATARQWLEEGVPLARASGADTDLAFLLVLLGFVESHLGQHAAAVHLDEGLMLLRTAGNVSDLALGLDMAIAPYFSIGEVATARSVLAESLSVAGNLGDRWLIAVALSSAGFMDVSERNWSSGRANLEQAVAIFSGLGDEGSIAIIYNNLGVVAREQGDQAHAADFLQRSVAMHHRLGLNAAITLSHLGDLSLRHGDLSQASAYLTDALRSASRGGEPRVIVLTLCRLARLATAVKESVAAARLLGAADALQDAAGATLAPEYRRELAMAIDAARATLGEAQFRVAAGEGAATPLAQLAATTLAWTESLSQIRSDVGSNATAPAVTAGLSTRETEVLRLIAGGKSNREIATTLVISLNTVARHVSNIFDKIGAANRTEAATYAHRQLLVD